MTRKNPREIERAVGQLEEQYKPGEPGLFVATPMCAFRDDDAPQWPAGVSKADITAKIPQGEDDVEYQLTIPHYQPERWHRPGIRMVAYSDIAWAWVQMPADVLEKEYDLRREQDEPIPPVLEEAVAAGGGS